MNLEDLKKEAEDLIRSGKRDQARALLLPLKRQPVPRARASDFANLARRAGLIPVALHIMSPIIRPKVPLDSPATDEEKATYALVLLGLGASLEALEVLESASSSDANVLLALAFTHINRWDYPSAIRYLKNYLKLSEPGPYQMLIAKVNLAASYVATGNAEDGKPLLAEILETTKANSWSLLHKNALELSAQIAIQEKNWAQAVSLLDRASGEGERAFNLDDFFVRKWQAVVALLRDGPSQPNLERLEKLKSEAKEFSHWETVRDCDYYRATAIRDPDLCLRVYFGTPYSRYRERIAESVKGWLELPETYVWQPSGQPASRTFDLQSGEELDGEAFLPVGKGLNKALQVMSSDFYRPFLIGSLHAAVFSGEHFNPVSSPRRVSFLIQRLREWFEENDIPLSINVSKEGYRLQGDGPYAFLLRRTAAPSSDEDPAHYVVMLQKLKSRRGSKALSASQIATDLEISIRSARYLVKWALEKKLLHKIGTGRATQYKIAR